MEAHTVITTTTHLAISGPFDLREIALMGFGHRDERAPGAKPSNHAAHPHVAAVRRQFRAVRFSDGLRPVTEFSATD